MRNAASCCQLLQEIWLPRGALSGVYPAGVSVSVGITDDVNGWRYSVATSYQLEYVVPSRAVLSDALWTSAMPVAIWLTLLRTSSCTGTQSALRVIRSTGIDLRYPARTRSSSDCE